MFFISLVSNICWSQTPSLHIESDLRVDPLAGSGNRPVYAEPDGTLIIGSDQSSTTRQLFFPAQSLNIGDQNIISRSSANGLTWAHSWTSAASITIQKPADFDVTGGSVKLVIYYYPTTTNGGSIQFFCRPKDFDLHDPLSDNFSINSETVFSLGENRILAANISFSAFNLSKDLWHISIQRNGSTTSYPDDVVVMSVTLSYPTIN